MNSILKIPQKSTPSRFRSCECDLNTQSIWMPWPENWSKHHEPDRIQRISGHEFLKETVREPGWFGNCGHRHQYSVNKIKNRRNHPKSSLPRWVE